MKVNNCQNLAFGESAGLLKRLGLNVRGQMRYLGTALILASGLVISSAYAQEEPVSEEPAVDVSTDEQASSPLSEDIEDLKKAALELNRDLLILEEELLFPANTQMVVFLSMDVGEFFNLDSVKLKVDDQVVASHLYTDRENDALIRGGIQRLYIGNVKTGSHEITAIFTGKGPDSRDYKRAASMVVEKDDDPKMLELRIRDATSNMQPEFDIKEWEL